MPTYAYRCPTCGANKDVLKPLAQLNSIEFCSACGRDMVRQVSAPRVMGDYAGYNCPITGKWIEGRRAHEENLARHGKRVYEPGETEAYQRSLKEADERLDKSVEETAEAFVHNLPTAKREALAADLQQGADVAFTRS